MHKAWFAALALLLAAALRAETFPEGNVTLEDLRGKDAPVEGLLHFQLKSGWHIYWIHPGDAGFPPSLSVGVDSARLMFPLAHRYDLGADIWAQGYSDSVSFPFRAPNWKGGKAQVKFLVCKESCLPRTLDLVPQPGDPDGIQKYLKSLPAASKERPAARLVHSGQNRELWLGFTDRPDDSVRLLVGVNDDWHCGRSLGVRRSRDTTWIGVAIQAYGDSSANSLRLLASAGPWRNGSSWQDSLVATAGPEPLETNPEGMGEAFWLALVMGLLGGLILNFMPCVLPVLALKALSVTKLANESHWQARLSGVATALGILSGLAALASLVVVLRTVGLGGWGAQFQEPRYVAALAALMVIFGVNLLGFFEFRAPGVVLKQHHSQLIGDFLQGLLAVALSTPCSAPILGSAIGYGLSQPAPVVYAVFLAIGFGLSIPYLALALFPALAKVMPHPGAWMETLRHVLALPIFATALWLIWVLGAQMERGSHLRIQFVMLLVAALAGWLGWAQHRLKSRLETALWIGLGLSLALVIIMAAWKPAPLAAKWQVFTPARFDSLQTAGRTVLVDGTADWCLSCKVNEADVFRNREVMAELNRHHVVLLRADWTRRDSVFGNWMGRYGRHAVPFAGLFAPAAAPDLWPEILVRPQVLRKLRALPQRPLSPAPTQPSLPSNIPLPFGN